MAHLRVHAEAVIVLRSVLERIEVKLGAAADEALQLLRLEQLEHLVLAPQLRPTTGQAPQYSMALMCYLVNCRSSRTAYAWRTACLIFLSLIQVKHQVMQLI